MNQLLGNNSVTVTLQWPREPGAVYHVNIKPEIPHNESIAYLNNFVVITFLTTFNSMYPLYQVSVVSLQPKY